MLALTDPCTDPCTQDICHFLSQTLLRSPCRQMNRGGRSSSSASDASHLVRRSAAVDAARNVPIRAKNKAVKLKTSLLENVPDYLRDNDYITAGYRVNYSFWAALRSLFRVHNETFNVWTHLFGFVLFILLTVLTAYARPAPLAMGESMFSRLEQRLVEYGSHLRILQYGQSQLRDLAGLEARLLAFGRSNYEALTDLFAQGKRHLYPEDSDLVKAAAAALELEWPTRRWPVYVFTAGAMTCLLTSSVCHLFACCTAHRSRAIWRFDYAGIAVLIVCSFYPPVVYGFQCHTLWRNFYLVTTSLLGVGTVVITLLPKFASQQYRHLRAGLFAGLGLWGIVPITHGWLLNGQYPEACKALALDILMGAIYLTGALIYAMRVPERWRPGSFNIVFNSHQIFHIAVVTAAWIHYRAIHIILKWRDASGGCVGLAMLG